MKVVVVVVSGSSGSSGSSSSSSSRSRSRSSSSSSLRELGPVSTHDVLCSWREVWVETKGHERRFRQRTMVHRVARVVAPLQIDVFAM